jgi:hypothetical protein
MKLRSECHLNITLHLIAMIIVKSAIFEVLTPVTMKMPSTGMLRCVALEKCYLLDVTPCDSCKNQLFGGTFHYHHQGGRKQRTRNSVSSNQQLVFPCSVLQLLVTASIVLSSLILSTLMLEAIRKSETSVLTIGTERHIPGDGILHHES